MNQAPAHAEENPKPVRRRFRPATPNESAIPVPVPELSPKKKDFGKLLPNETLKALAAQHGALDERERKLTCTVFFWMAVLAMGPGGLVHLSAMVSAAAAACLMAGLSAAKAVSSKEAISDNFERRPWQFFEVVLQHLLAAYATLFATPQGIEVQQLIQMLNPVLVDATVMRVANRLIQTFPAIRTGRCQQWAGVKLHMAFRLLRGVPEVMAITAQKANERTVNFLREKGEQVLYIFDLGYWKYALFDDIIERGQHFISRLREDCNPLIKAVYMGDTGWVGKRLKEIVLTGIEVDLLVNLTSDNPKNPRMAHDVRMVGQWVEKDSCWHLYITSLLDWVLYPVSFIVELYALRWQVEILFRDLKCVLRIENFIAMSVNGVLIQIYAALIYYVFTRIIVLKAAHQTETPVEEFSMPKCLVAVGQVLNKYNELLIKGQQPDWEKLEEQLVEVVIATGLRPNRKRVHRLTKVKTEFHVEPVPMAEAA